MDENMGKANIIFGWCWLFLGIIGAMWLGLYAFIPDWLGGYASLPRRLLRLAHISFMALALTNILYGLCLDSTGLTRRFKRIGSFAMIITAIGMPLACLASVYNIAFQILFPIPVIFFCIAVLIMIVGQIKRIKI